MMRRKPEAAVVRALTTATADERAGGAEQEVGVSLVAGERLEPRVVMAGLVPAIHVLLAVARPSRGCPEQVRA